MMHYHFIGIGGIGMGALATLILAKGHSVSGSDIRENQITMKLKKMGANICIGHAEENINEVDYVVYSSAIREDNLEMIAAKNKGCSLRQRAEVLASLMQDYEGITVAGAHGKTTTASMIANLLAKAGLNPTTAVGGIIHDISTNAVLGSGKYFVAEVDESDGSFLHFSPYYSVITNIDKEHMEYYGDEETLFKAYKNYINQTNNEGVVLGFDGDEKLKELMNNSSRRCLTYGFESSSLAYAKDVEISREGTSFQGFVKGDAWGRVSLKMPGIHNVENALACIGIGVLLDIEKDVIIESLKEFSGVRRRFQNLGQYLGITIIDDYAHHPTEIRKTLQAAKAQGYKRVVAVFQPHRYSRLQNLYQEFVESFDDCDQLVVTDIYSAGEKNDSALTPEEFCESVNKRCGLLPQYVEKNELPAYLQYNSKEGDLVIALGAGDISSIIHQFADFFKDQNASFNGLIKEKNRV